MRIVRTLSYLDGSQVERVALDPHEEEELRFEYLGREFTLPLNHSCSHYHQPVLVDERREAIGEGSIPECQGRWVLGAERYAEAVRVARGAMAGPGE